MPAHDPLRPGLIDKQAFELHAATLARHFHVLKLSEAKRRLEDGTLPSRAVTITFDDGYADNATLALPILQRYGLSATFFIATDYLDGGRMWNDTVIEAVRLCRKDRLDLRDLDLGEFSLGNSVQRCAAIYTIIPRLKHLEQGERQRRVNAIADIAEVNLPSDLMMSSDQVRLLSKRGMEIGAHTMSHPILSIIPEEQARLEIAGSRAFLSNLLDLPISSFAYPNGKPGLDYDQRHVALVRELGFEVAVSTAHGCVRGETDRHQLPRLGCVDRTYLRFLMRLGRCYFSTPPQNVHSDDS